MCIDKHILPLGQMATTVINPISISILECADRQADPSNKIPHKLKSVWICVRLRFTLKCYPAPFLSSSPHPPAFLRSLVLLILHLPGCPAMVLRTGCGCICAECGLGRGVCWAYLCYPAAQPLCTLPCHRSLSGRQGGSQPCGFVRVWNHRWTQINTDIAAKIWLYLNFHHIIKIKIHNCRYLRSSAFICG